MSLLKIDHCLCLLAQVRDSKQRKDFTHRKNVGKLWEVRVAPPRLAREQGSQSHNFKELNDANNSDVFGSVSE